MKRLVISNQDPAEFRGGAERVVEAMVAARIRRGDEVVLFAGSERREGEGRIEQRGEPGLAVHRVIRADSETGDLFLRPRIRLEFERLLDGARPDVVEWHHGANLSLDLVRSAASRRVPVVMVLHDLWLSCPRFFRTPPAGIRCPECADRSSCAPCVGRDLGGNDARSLAWVRFFTDSARAELSAARLRVAPSRAHADALQSFFPDLPLDLRVIPHGLLELDLPPPPKRSGPVEPGKLRLVSFGNLTADKGLEDLAAALAALPDPSRVSLDLFGREMEPGFVDRLRALAPAVAIRSHGPYERFRDIFDRVAACDLAVFPSRARESYGLVVDEAFAAGLPVLVSDRGALPERVGAAGCSIAASRVGAWTEALNRLLGSPAECARRRESIPGRAGTVEDAIRAIDAALK